MPADPILIAGFVASHIATCSAQSIKLWINGLRLWHLFNRAEWMGDDPLVKSLQTSAAAQGMAFKRPPRHPISLDHLRLLHDSLNFTAPRSYAIWAAALTAFWGCRRLGKLLPLSQRNFDPIRNITINCNICLTPVRDRCAITIHIPWTKTTRFAGADCSLTQREDLFCPVRALSDHLVINHPSDGSPLFSFQDSSSCTFSLSFLTKDTFLSITKSNYNL